MQVTHPEIDQKKTAPRGLLRRLVRPWLLLSMGLLLLAAAVGIYAYAPPTEEDLAREREGSSGTEAVAAAIEAVVLQPGDFPLRAEATGRLMPWRETEISAEASGLVVERPIEVGAYAQAGDLLLRLSDPSARLELEEAEAALLQARAEYAVEHVLGRSQGMNSFAFDSARVRQIQDALREAEAAFERGETTESALEAARRRVEVTSALDAEVLGDVQAIVAGLFSAEHRVKRAQAALERLVVTAPFAGRISDIDVEVGQRVSPGLVVLRLLDDARMKVDVDVLESDLVGLRDGASAWVRVPSMADATYRGSIHAINPRIDPRTGTGRVTVAIPNAGSRLISGLFAYVQLETRRLSDRLVLPARAILVRQGRDLVFRANGGRAEWVYVTLGERSGEHVEVLEGVAAGDTIAVAGHFALAHDAPVEVATVQPVSTW